VQLGNVSITIILQKWPLCYNLCTLKQHHRSKKKKKKSHQHRRWQSFTEPLRNFSPRDAFVSCRNKRGSGGSGSGQAAKRK
ncbi:Myosin-2, partial [Clarias magur]